MIKIHKKNLGSDLLLSIAGISLMNIVVQFAVYPYLTQKTGAENFGVALYLLSVVSIMGTFGISANYSRMVVNAKQNCTNGDYNIYLSAILVLCLIVSFVALLVLSSISLISYIGYTILMSFSVLRYYGDVQFRLTLNFKGFFIYYLLLSIGYIFGLMLYQATNSWILTILTGEVFAFIFVRLKGSIYRKPYFKKSDYFNTNIRSVSLLTGTNLISTFIQNSDRILILFFIGSYEVTVFYAATLIGKAVALLTVPLNGVIISYLAQYNGRLTKRFFILCMATALMIGVFALAGGMAVSYFAVRLLYPEVYEDAKQLLFIANSGQIMFFVSGVLMTFLLKFADEKYQLYINIFYLIIFTAIVIPFIAFWGLWGIAYGLLIVNSIRFVIVGVVGLNKVQYIV